MDKIKFRLPRKVKKIMKNTMSSGINEDWRSQQGYNYYKYYSRNK